MKTLFLLTLLALIPYKSFAGCAYQINYVNTLDDPITLSKISVRLSGSTEGWYKKRWVGSTVVGPGDEYQMSVRTQIGCGSWKEFKTVFFYKGKKYSAKELTRSNETSFDWVF
ncbi:MAG: hypothetical protein HOE90_03790 [Bacteriovoracaceae bacterium]|jgi:hypothetical protein|nr:hypothetical protein [Bacteriovoracaceae bacterium]